jgi:ferrous iron transport protein A
MTKISLGQMKAGQSGAIIKIHGGHGIKRKLDAMGMRQGVMITKVSAQIMQGPVIVRVGNAQIAIGFGMARKIFVAID